MTEQLNDPQSPAECQYYLIYVIRTIWRDEALFNVWLR